MKLPWLSLALALVASPALADSPPLPSPTARPSAPASPTLLSWLANGLSAEILVRAGDPLGDGTLFPPKNDLTAFFPTGGGTGVLMVGHEIAWKREAHAGRFTKLSLQGDRLAHGQMWTTGMHNNCAGGVTPWGTVLSGEEYPHQVLDAPDNDAKKAIFEHTRVKPTDFAASFGWIYEIDPRGATPAGQAQRRTAMGRYSHESAQMVGDRTVYLTEDYEGGFLYKFVAAKPRDLSAGSLFAYQRTGRWVPIRDPYNAHLDAVAAGATPYMRFEDAKLGPDGALYLAETGAFRVNDPYGRVLKLDLKTLKMTTVMEGDGTHMANPDNLIFDKQGRLIICEDQYDQNLARFGDNQVLRLERNRTLTPLCAIRHDGEPTGPSFTPDFGTMFLSVMAGDESGIVAIKGL